MRDHMMGWPAAMLVFEPEQKKQYITPARSIRNLSDEWETKDFSYILGQGKKEEKKPESPPNKPAGVWIKTSERKPPKVGLYWSRFNERIDTATGAWWDGARNVVGWEHNSITHYRVVE